MGLFSKKVDYDELYRKLSSEKMTPEETRKAEKELKKLAKSGDKRGVIWRPLTSVQIQSVGSVNWATSEFEEAEHKYGICEEYVRVRSLPIVFNLFNESYEKYNDPKGAVFVARAYEHGWGVEKNHGKAVEIIRETENYPKDGTFRLNSDLIKNAYKEITGTEFPDSESSKQKEKQAISDAAKNQNEQPQSDINFKRIEYDGGDVYEGETRNGKRHGKGKYTWSDGSFYDGEWKDDRKDGNGKQSHPDGTCYDGGWKDDKMDGFGVLVYSNQSRYEGHWSEGTENGHGMLTFANGNRYDGEWKDGNENGHGIKKYINVGVYDGEWKDGDENGHGTMTFANGNRYDGDWVDGDMNGNGIYTYANGEKYKVTCKEDEIISKEPFETPKTSSTVIRSNQKAKTEYKQIRYDSGDVYEGETQNGKRHGKGKYTWADGDTYEGDWKDDKRCGRGKLVEYGKSPSGETYMKYSYDGEWLDSKEHGHGICVEGDFGWEKMDKVFEGEWVDGKRQGRFVWYYTNSKGGRYINFYEDGKWIEGGIPYDESIRTVEDARRARALADGKSSSTTPVYTNSSPAAVQDSADTAEDFEWEEFSSVGELHEKLLRPELFRDPRDRYLLNSCMYLEPFVDEFHEEFAGGDYAETKEIIAEILGVESGELTECIERRLDFIRGFTEKEYLLAAMYSLVYDERTDLAPYLANLACYLWTDTGDGDYLDPLLDLFRLSGEYDDDDSTWLCAILRLQENGNIDDPLKPNDDGSFDDQFADFDDVFGDLLEQGYLPGSDGKMYLSDSDDNGGDETEESDTGDNVLLRYQNGDSYRGAAVGGVREGFGAYFYADDGYYRGTFHQGVFHGYGIREYGNGHTYKGMWKNDTKNGYGEYTFADGRSYFGWWKDDCFQGFGCMTLSGGEVYVGEYENHKENGIFLYNRGNKWSGYKAADGKVIGSSAGRWTAYKDGSEYCGPIIERRRGNTIYRVKEGFGEYCFPDDDSECPSDRYLGQFKDDMPYGTGIRLYTSPETDMPIIMASNDFRGDIIPRGHFQSVCGIKDPSGNCDFFLYYVGECKDSVCYGRGVMYVIGTTERSRYTPYGVKGGSIIYCDTFREHPDGPATVINRYGEELHGRFVDGMFEQYK